MGPENALRHLHLFLGQTGLDGHVDFKSLIHGNMLRFFMVCALWHTLHL